MKYGSTEYRYVKPIVRHLETNSAFKRWVISKTEFSDMADARLLNSEMETWRGNSSAEWWRFHFTEKCRCAGCSGKETDILAIFETSAGVRFALHFEVKQPLDKFKSDGVQSRGYPLRAQCWVATPPAKVLPHNKASTVLLFSEQKRDEYAPHIPSFQSQITFEEIGRAFPDLVIPEPA